MNVGMVLSQLLGSVLCCGTRAQFLGVILSPCRHSALSPSPWPLGTALSPECGCHAVAKPQAQHCPRYLGTTLP